MSAGPGGNTSSPVDCSVCNHSGRYTQCPGCGGLLGMGSWPPCKYCHAAIGVADPPPVPPMVSTIHSAIEATEPQYLPPLEAFAAEAAVERREPIEGVIEELELQREAIRDLSRRITELTQAVLGRNS